MTRLVKNEWKKGYPIKKALIGFLWIFFFFATIGMAIEHVTTKTEPGHLSGVIVPGLLLLATFKTVKRYLQTKYHAMPYLYTVLRESTINSLLNEEVHKIEEFKKYGIYHCVQESEHWLVVNGKFILKDLVVECSLYPKGTTRWTTHFEAVYLTGEIVDIGMGIQVTDDNGKNEFYKYINSHTDIMARTLYLASQSRMEKIHAILKRQGWNNKGVDELLAHSMEFKEIYKKESI